MTFKNIFDKDEVGLISVLPSQGFGTGVGDDAFYAYWAHTSGMRISKFTHVEHSGGLTSRGAFHSEQMLWHDTDGFPYTSDTSGMGYGHGHWCTGTGSRHD